MTDLEALECIVVDLTPKAKEHNKEEIEQIRKSLEVLDIIKKKEVNIRLLKGILHSDIHTHTASYYDSYFVANYRHLTQEEFDLLKEWLEWKLIILKMFKK